jgi:hypothetical protein
MLVSYADWKKPTDAAYAFQLRALGDALVPVVPALGVRSDIRSIAREVLEEADALRFAQRVHRWSGPEDTVGTAGEQPYAGLQETFVEMPWSAALSIDTIEAALRGDVLVFRHAGGQTDYVLRDHHMIDVALYHYRTTGALPTGLIHADRHSDYCKDSFLDARQPDQAATWWKLFEGLKRPGNGASVLTEEQIFFAASRAAHQPWMSGRPFESPLVVPWFLSPRDLVWNEMLQREGAMSADWVSIDLDYLQPSPQLALGRGLLRDARFHTLMQHAKVRVFVLSPQFTNGGDRHETWSVQGSMHSSLRLVNVLRSLPGRVRVTSL